MNRSLLLVVFVLMLGVRGKTESRASDSLSLTPLLASEMARPRQSLQEKHCSEIVQEENLKPYMEYLQGNSAFNPGQKEKTANLSAPQGDRLISQVNHSSHSSRNSIRQENPRETGHNRIHRVYQGGKEEFKNKKFFRDCKWEFPSVFDSGKRNSQNSIKTSLDSQLKCSIGLLIVLITAFLTYSITKRHFSETFKKLYEQKSKQEQEHFLQIEKIQKQASFYQVFWDQLIFQIQDKKCYSHRVFEGRFILQPAFVYVVALEGMDIETVQAKLKKLLICSHSKLCKLFFYCKTEEYLLVFTQKISPLSQKMLPNYLNTNATQSEKKRTIIEIIQALDYLQEKIELKWLPLHSIELEKNSKNDALMFNFKINAIPCLFRKMPHNCVEEDNDTTSEDTPCFVRSNIAALFHLILLNGQSINVHKRKPKTWRQNKHEEEYGEFLTFILSEAKTMGHTHELLFREVKDHPFLWCTNKKILFLSDFSNFVETYLDNSKVNKMQDYAKLNEVLGADWSKHLHLIFAQQINSHRKYNFESVKDLLRMIRNKINHFYEMPKGVRSVVGTTPEQFLEYSLDKFPKLLYFAYNYSRKKKWKIHLK